MDLARFLVVFAGLLCTTWAAGACPERCACALLTVVCTGQGLSSIPPGVPAGTIRLDLQQNQITRIYKDDFANLTSLKYLDLSNNALATIDEGAFSDLMNLERIRLNKNKLRQLPDYLFSRMKKLNRLDLSENELEILTNAQIMGSQAMRNLQLDKNRLTCMETEVLREWKMLEIFTVNGNRLTTLDKIDELPNLRIFRVFDNPWLCDCRMKWMRHSVNASMIAKVKCHRPLLLQGHNLLRVKEEDMKCSGIEKRAATSCADKKRCPAECACTATIVDCHDRSLFHIPSNLPDGIEEIRLNGNRITTVPGRSFEKLKKLRTLDLSRNLINDIASDAFAGLSNLQHLHLFHNNISELSPLTFLGLEVLEMLMLNANNLHCLPKDLFKDQARLRVLSVYKNRIKSIENGTFDGLKSIGALHLSENPYICDCNLEWLAHFLGNRRMLDNSGVKCAAPKRMIGVPFAKTEVEKFKCKGSEYLVTKSAGQCLIDNPCPAECTCFGTVVDCSNRGLIVIPTKLPRFTTTVLLNGNLLMEVPAHNGLQRIANLEKIDLSNNNISLIEQNAFHGLQKLRELVLNNNKLTNFAYTSLGDSLASIERLHLNANRLECVSKETFGKMRNLTLLVLSDNKIKSISAEIFQELPRLHSIYLANNDLVCDCLLLPLAKFLVEASTLKILDNVTCALPEPLRSSDVTAFANAKLKCEQSHKSDFCTSSGGYCPLGCTCERTVVRCSRAGLAAFPTNLPADTTELFLNNNNITEIDDVVLNRLKDLLRLDLSHNQLTVLPNNVFRDLSKLDVLIINFNQLQCIEDAAFDGLNSLRILSMHGNLLSQLPERAFNGLTKTLQQIAMLNNPLHCDCHLAWFNRWISQSYVESGLSKCAGPSRMLEQLVLTASPQLFACNEPVPKAVLAKCNPCVNSPCRNDGICVRGAHRTYDCQCKVGFYGQDCELEIDACYGKPCDNGGRCEVTEEGRFKCHCAKGFSGSYCQTNVDDCMGNKCKNGGVCVDEVNSYRCECSAMFGGKFCEEKIELCSRAFNPCQNNGKCERLSPKSYKCHCLEGFSGQNCTTKVDNCLPNSCHNNGVCMSMPGGFSCTCKVGFVGEFCEIPLPSMLYYHGAPTCNEDTCKNGVCGKNEDDEIECKCHFGFSGKLCDEEMTIGFSGVEDGFASVHGFDSSVRSNLTFSLRTMNLNGILLYYGDESQYISVELFDGRIRTAVCMGENEPSLMYSYLRVNDGLTHLVRLEIEGNTATMRIDDVLPQKIINKGRTKKLELNGKQPVYFGGVPATLKEKLISQFRIKSAEYMAGCLSDVFLNENNVNFADDSVVVKKGTTRGCGPTVNLCQNVSCNNAGRCFQNLTLENGYQCNCDVSYAGKLCEERRPSCNKIRFRRYHEENGCRSLDMIKNAECVGWCGDNNSPRVVNPDGSTMGPGCCCKAVKTRQRKVRMMCSDGSHKHSIVQIIRKCQCFPCQSHSFIRF